ncbi:MAG: hypothetical protein R6X15_00225 [Pseudomonadota bacterium]
MRNRWCFLLPLIFLTGCAAPQVQTSLDADPSCRQLFHALDQAVDRARVRDQGPLRVPGFPYLRMDRFLASFSDEVDEPEGFDAWTQRLGRLDREARRLEIANLPDSQRSQLQKTSFDGADLISALDICRSQLIESELAIEANRRLLREQAEFPDDYVPAWRVIGLYPVTALFVKAGVANWHDEVEETYARPLEELPTYGTLRSWQPLAAPRLNQDEVAALLRDSADNSLGIPEPDAKQRDALFQTFAPQWRIDTADTNDLPGTPYFSDGVASVNTGHPAVFRRLSHTRFGDDVLLQLNYIVWFKARPPAGSFDIYAGPIDGINFRVTLDAGGKPLLFDTIHNCGCYHKFFPVAPLVADEAATGFWTEAPLVPDRIEQLGQIPVLHVASRTHYVDRLSFTSQPEGERYHWDEYHRLRSLLLASGDRRSLFDDHGIIEESARPERVLLWPMGIRSPGAMRQWGRHPTAFVGRRHYDDPYLIERLFDIAPNNGATP